ncbi:MAG: pyridoxine 5'-phosphate synthase [Rhodobiaceae bacterium]|jgi:pyridoxine 5-phosphate synthase|nr:pyridoxine 5'-phosphate synthase [Rhodobiaceae bacterium]MBT5517816.1 pyridoxine 5'-phosphate synthase [Rhodobiaceae bacterium]
MPNLSVNLNKIALLRNAREGNEPDLLWFASQAIQAGAPSLTVHPREDERHIRLQDVIELSNLPQIKNATVELNIEGDLRDSLIDLVCEIGPTQFTAVPATKDELTSTRGFDETDDLELLAASIAKLKSAGVGRVSVLCNPSATSCTLAHLAGADAIELYTGDYAKAFKAGAPEPELNRLVESATMAKSNNLRLHGGHDLTLDNLPMLLKQIDFLELSIGHGLTIEALCRGWQPAISSFIHCLLEAPSNA